MVGVDVRYEDQIGRLGLRQIGLARDGVDDDHLPTLLELDAGVSERRDHNFAAGGRNASGRGYLSRKRRSRHDRRQHEQAQTEVHVFS